MTLGSPTDSSSVAASREEGRRMSMALPQRWLAREDVGNDKLNLRSDCVPQVPSVVNQKVRLRKGIDPLISMREWVVSWAGFKIMKIMVKLLRIVSEKPAIRSGLP